MWTMKACDSIKEQLSQLQRALLSSAEEGLTVPMPGYTHLQHAQPITWGHWILSHFWPLARDTDRFTHARASASVLPLGSAALAGTAFAVDRHALAAELSFDAVCENSIDGVSDRDFAVDFLYAAAITGLHLSRLSEQLIIFNSREFQFVILDDSYTTGSSLMPQKKNPDALEITRGKSGRLIGNLTGLLVTLKGLPSAYDRDLQEDKEPVFDAFDALMLALPVMSGVIQTLKICPEHMAAQLDAGMLATDLADHLVRQGMPFREAHRVVGHVVRLAEQRGVGLADLSPDEFSDVSDQFGHDLGKVFDMDASLASRDAVGGSGPEALRKQLRLAWRKSTQAF
jgi:argininosuccinate lyase